ncbi:MAG: response regulator [Nitrospirota bacterium]
MSEESKKLGDSLAELHSGDPERNIALCVDDEPAIKRLLSRIIPHFLPNVKVEEAECPDEAIDKISGELVGRVAFVFSDMEMPGGKNGMDLANALRGENADPDLKENMKNVPFVIGSGNTDYANPSCEQGQTMQALIDEGIVDVFVSKPFLPNDIKEAIEEAVNRVMIRVAGQDQEIQ